LLIAVARLGHVAQPDYPNALQHGFCFRQYRSIDIQDLDAFNFTLLDEIAPMRVAGRRMMELLDQITDPIEAVRCCAVFVANSNLIARLPHPSGDFSLPRLTSPEHLCYIISRNPPQLSPPPLTTDDRLPEPFCQFLCLITDH